MPVNDLKSIFLFAIDMMDAEGLDYMVVGAIAVAIWGIPRETTDVDIVVVVEQDKEQEFVRKAVNHGFEIEYEEKVVRKLRSSGVARLKKNSRFVDIIVPGTEFEDSAISRKVSVKIFDREVFIASAEDIILYKLIANRPRDIDDVRRVGFRQAGKLDAVYLRKWAKSLSEALDRPNLRNAVENLINVGT